MKNFLLIHNLIKAGFYLISGEGDTKKRNEITLGFGHSELKNVSTVSVKLDKTKEEYKHIKDLLKL